MTDAARSAALKALRANLPNLDDRGRSFAESIIEYLERGTLSEAQWAWVPYLSGTGPKPVPKGARKPYRAKRQANNADNADELRQAREALKGQSREINSLTAEVERLKREVRAAKEAARKANRKAEEASKAPKGDPNWEAMVRAMTRATSAQRKLVMRSLHPDRWNGAEWATKVFQAANK